MRKPPQDADIVTRLRYSGSLSEVPGSTLEDEAAAEIERQRAAVLHAAGVQWDRDMYDRWVNHHRAAIDAARSK